MNNKIKHIGRISLLLLLAIPLSIVVNNSIHLKKAQTEFNGMMSGIDEQVPDLMRPKLLDSPLIKDVAVSINSSVEQAKYHDFYNWTEHCVVTFYVDDTFDMFADRTQYDFIEAHGELVYDVKSEIVRKLFPKYNAYSNLLTEENDSLRSIYGSGVFLDKEYDVFFETSNNVYQYAVNIDDYFLKNGKDYWIQTNKKSIYSARNSIVTSRNGKCILSHCNSATRPGKSYCWTHSCCKDNCDNFKEPTVHCCSIHNCAYDQCGMHRYDYKGSIYCTAHYNKQ